MNPLERANDLQEVLLQMLRNWQSGLWTALPGTIQTYDATKQTCTLQLNTQLQRLHRDGTKELITIQNLVDVPIVFPSGGGYSITFPVAKGDEALVVFSSRCMDGWYAYGGPQPQGDLRMHDLSDGFAILGIRNQTRQLSPAPSGNTFQLRSDDGAATIEIAANHVINVTGANVNVTATNTATIKAASIVFKNAGSALKKLVNETFLDLFDNHQHMYSPGPGSSTPSGKPIVPSVSTNKTSTVEAE